MAYINTIDINGEVYNIGNLTDGEHVVDLPTLTEDSVFLLQSDVINSLTSSNQNKPLSANQGKMLNDKIAQIAKESDTQGTELTKEINQLKANIAEQVATLKDNISTGDSNTLESAKSYADDILEQAERYAGTEGDNALSEAKKYADTKVSSMSGVVTGTLTVKDGISNDKATLGGAELDFSRLDGNGNDFGTYIQATGSFDSTNSVSKPSLEFYGANGDESVKLRNIAAPELDTDAANKKYVDDQLLGAEVDIGGKNTTLIDVSTPSNGALRMQVGTTDARLGSASIFADSLDMNETLISNVKTPVNASDVATKGYVDSYKPPIDDGSIAKVKLAADLLSYLDGEMVSSDDWTYIKKDSGLVLAWSTTKITLAMSADSDINSTIAKKYPDGLFISTPICIPYLHGSQSFYQYNKKAGTPTWTPELGIYNLGDAATSVSVTVDFFVIGKWK